MQHVFKDYEHKSIGLKFLVSHHLRWSMFEDVCKCCLQKKCLTITLEKVTVLVRVTINIIETPQPHHSSSSKEVKTGFQTGQDLEVGTDAEAIKSAAYMSCSVLFLEFRTISLGMVPPTITWALLHQSVTKKKTHPIILHTACSYEGIFLIVVSSSSMAVACFKLI